MQSQEVVMNGDKAKTTPPVFLVLEELHRLDQENVKIVQIKSDSQKQNQLNKGHFLQVLDDERQAQVEQYLFWNESL